MNSFLTNLIAAAMIVATPTPSPLPKPVSTVTYSLGNRHEADFVNDVFRDNILLTVEYMGNKARKGEKIVWDAVGTKGPYVFSIQPGETFAFHETVSDKYAGKVTATTNAHFDASEGFKSDGWLVGDGVCHLASFMKVAAEKAGLEVEAPARHDFARIPDVVSADGVSIFSYNKTQNLYITNNRDSAVQFKFSYSDGSLTIEVSET